MTYAEAGPKFPISESLAAGTVRIAYGPTSNVFVKGPLQGPTARAGGAFAGYVITFLIALPTTGGINALATRLLKPVWTLQADVVVVDRKGKEIRLANFAEDLRVTFRPKLYQVGSRDVALSFPMTSVQWPYVLLEIPGFGAQTIDLKGKDDDVDRDETIKTIRNKVQVIIRQQG